MPRAVFCANCGDDSFVEQVDGGAACTKHGPIDDNPMVWISTGTKAIAYHKVKDCKWRIKGQEAVISNMGDAAPMTYVTTSSAVSKGLGPCRSCCQ